MSELLSVPDALERILEGFTRLPSERVTLEQALGRVLAEDILAPISLPPFANSSMDGFAVRAADVRSASADAPVRLRVVGDIPAGIAPAFVVQAGEAARIMTGAMLPEGTDAVIPVEDTDTEWSAGDHVALPDSVGMLKAVKRGDYVRPIGEDMQAGEVLLTAGTLIHPAALGALAAQGIPQITVIRQPRVALISSGDELVAVDQPLAPGKIHNVNAYTLAGLIAQYGGIVFTVPAARDQREDVRRAFQAALDWRADVIVSSAGVSVGTADLVRGVMEEMGEINFWRINLRPGKPLAYGQIGGVPFFGLPGNPVSAMVTFDVFVRPVLLKLSGRTDQPHTVMAALGERLTSDGRRSYIRVTLQRTADRWVAHSTGTQSSGAISSMVKADGLLILPEGVTDAAEGDVFQVRVLRLPE